MPWAVGYPVNFYSGGDTTSQAFAKHINEIKRIYGFLNNLDSAKVDATSINTAITAHANSTNPHPKWEPVTWEKVQGVLTGAHMTTLLAQSGVSMAASQLTGLADIVNPLIDDKIDEIPKTGIKDAKLQTKGYAKFENGLILQWGKSPEYASGSEDFGNGVNVPFYESFPNACFSVVISGLYGGITNKGNRSLLFLLQMDEYDKDSFTFRIFGTNFDFYGSNWSGKFQVSYIAIGN